MSATLYKKNFIWNVIGLTSYSFVSLILFIAVKLINGTEVAGIFTYSFSLCTLFLFIALYYNRTYQMSNIQFSFNQYLSSRIVTVFISFILIIFFSLLSNFNSDKTFIILSLMLFRVIDALSDCFYALLQSKEKLYQVGISYFMKSILGMVAFVICDILTKNVLLSILTLAVVNLIVFCIYDFKCYKKMANSKFKFSLDGIVKIYGSTFSVFIFSFLSIYLANSQKYVITYFSSNEIQTIFGILIMPATLISLIGNYLIQPFLTKFIEFLNQKKFDKFNQLTFKIILALVFLGIIGTIVCYFIGIPILSFIYQINLDSYKIDLLMIIIGSIFVAIGMIFSNILTVLESNKSQVFVYLIASIVSTVLCYICVKTDVIRGASLSYLISSIVLVLGFISLYFYIINNRKLSKNN